MALTLLLTISIGRLLAHITIELIKGVYMWNYVFIQKGVKSLVSVFLVLRQQCLLGVLLTQSIGTSMQSGNRCLGQGQPCGDIDNQLT